MTRTLGYGWTVLAIVEAGAAALCLAALALGPFSFRSGQHVQWLALAAVVFALYLATGVWTKWTGWNDWTNRANRTDWNGWTRWLVTVPFAVIFAAGAVALQLRPQLAGRLWFATSPIQPFPILGAGTILLAVLLVKVTAATSLVPADENRRMYSAATRWAVPVAMVLLGLFQATVYILPIGNASLRFWAIADGIFAGNGYPLTLTEPGPMSAGSPPYVYDLPLFPLLIRAAFGFLGHNSAAMQIPGIISSALFPLAFYLLLKQATGSRVTAVVFAALASLFPYLRIWVLNLPDPDPFFLTSLCFAAYLYLRALAAKESLVLWTVSGLAAGVASLARPEGVLYVGFLGLGVLASRPRPRQLVAYVVALGLFIAPTVAVWVSNFGFLWPQNYNHTLSWGNPLQTYRQLDTPGGIPLYYKGLGIGAPWALGLLALFVLSSLAGTISMVFHERRLLAMAVPGIGNTAMIFFTNPWISNAFHYADFFRHASFGIPFMVVACAYGFQVAAARLLARPRWRVAPYVCLLLLVGAVLREGDILANPTSTHRPGNPLASQVLTDATYLSMQAILEHPMSLPAMSFQRDRNGMLVGYPADLPWPDTAIRFFKPFDMSYDREGTAFGYASTVVFLLALGFAALGEGGLLSQLSAISYQSSAGNVLTLSGSPEGEGKTRLA